MTHQRQIDEQEGQDGPISLTWESLFADENIVLSLCYEVCYQDCQVIRPGDQVFDPEWPMHKFVQDIIHSDSSKIQSKQWPLKWPQGFHLTWPFYLILNPKWPIIKLVKDFVNTNILTQFCVHKTKFDATRQGTKTDHKSSPWALYAHVS